MAIQNRRGVYNNFTPSKMVPGEFAVVQSGDPNGKDGKAVYIAFGTGDARRIATADDIEQEIETSTESIADALVQRFEDEVADDLETAQTAATNANTSAQTASTKASEAAQSASQATQTVANIIDNTLTQTEKAADAKKVGDEIDSLKGDLRLLEDEIPDTVQTYTFTDGKVTTVLHKRFGTTIRTDAFTYGTSTITETRTLSTGESLTIVTNLTTLETTITYAAA